ncbi:small ribosomal subunit protein mS38 [Dipodomys merriami]|uniref:small ribosomal subunit protein mS38 n=1 Tax=Dipodomys merriami TaxID=94247 RepID=UPI003855FF73
MFLARLTPRLIRAVPWTGRSRPWPISAALGSRACRFPYGLQPVGLSRAASLPGKGVQLAPEELLVPRKMAISPLESWLTVRYLFPRLDAGAPVSEAPAHSCECPPPSLVEEEIPQGDRYTLPIQCKNVLKIRRRKMNHHKYRKLVKRTRFLRRKVREGRLKRKQTKFERDLKRIWLKAGLKEAPEGWQTPKIYGKNR